MSAVKLSILLIYAVIAAVAVVASGSTIGNIAQWSLLILVVAHTIEMAVFYRRCQQAGGSMAAHMLNVFLFGVFHIKELGSAGSQD